MDYNLKRMLAIGATIVIASTSGYWLGYQNCKSNDIKAYKQGIQNGYKDGFNNGYQTGLNDAALSQFYNDDFDDDYNLDDNAVGQWNDEKIYQSSTKKTRKLVY